MSRRRKEHKPKPAGGFDVTHGHRTLFKLVRRYQIRPWRTVIRRLLLKLSKYDPRVSKMLEDAECTWLTYDAPAYSQWASLDPLGKQQALFKWILSEGTKRKRSAVDIIASGLAGSLWWEFHVQPRHDDYSRAVDTARPVWFLLRQEWKDYERDNGHGSITVQRVCLTVRVRLQSRYACQKVEAEIHRVAGWFLEEYRGRLIEELQKAQLI